MIAFILAILICTPSWSSDAGIKMVGNPMVATEDPEGKECEGAVSTAFGPELTPGVPTFKLPSDENPDLKVYMGPGKISSDVCVVKPADYGAKKLVIGNDRDQIRISAVHVICPAADFTLEVLAKRAHIESPVEISARLDSGEPELDRHLVQVRLIDDCDLTLLVDDGIRGHTDFIFDIRDCSHPPKVSVHTKLPFWPGCFPRGNCGFISEEEIDEFLLHVTLLDADGVVSNPDKGKITVPRFSKGK